MTTARRTILIGSSALLVTALLSGCAANLLGSPISSAELSAPTETPVADPGPKVGDVVTSATRLLTGQREYRMADGTSVVISSRGPVPDSVLADVKTAADKFNTASADPIEMFFNQKLLVSNQLHNTQSIVIVQTMGLIGDDHLKGLPPRRVYGLIISGKWVGVTTSYDPAVTTTTANDYIAAHGGTDAGWKILSLI